MRDSIPVDTIDAALISTEFFSHSYFSNNWPRLSDIHSMLVSDKLPSELFGLAELVHDSETYYAFRPT